MAANEEESMPSGSQTLPNLKKRRQQRPCDMCRQRKIRCDSHNMASGQQCSNCVAFGFSCTYTIPSKKRGPRTSRQIEDLKNQIAALEAKIRSMSFCSLCAQPLQPRPGDSSSSASITQPGSPESADSPPASKDILNDELVDRFNEVSLGGLKCKFFRSGGTFALLSDALAVREKLLGSSSRRRATCFQALPWEQELYDQRPHYVYPEPDLIASLLELYFTNVHPTLPILHRPSFERSVAERLYLRDTKFGAALLAVLAVASRYSDDPRVLVNGDLLSSGWPFVAQVEIVQKHFYPSIYEVQFYCLMTLFAIGTSVPQMSWLYLGLGVRFLQYRGAHRRKGGVHDFEAELWNRAFWSLFLMDRMTCGFSGREVAINLDDFDVGPPLDVDDEYWEVGFTQPPGKPSRLSFLVLFVRLCEILGDALHRLYASKQRKTLMGWIGPDWEQGAVAGLDSAMNNFLDSIPPHLRWDSDNNETGPFSLQSAILYMMYYYVQITIHRPFVHKATTLAGPSLSICTSAARSALHIADRVWMTRVHELPSFFVQTPVFVSTLILVMSIFGPKRTAGLSVENIKDLERLEKALEILKLGATRSQTAGRQLAHRALNSPMCDLRNPLPLPWSPQGTLRLPRFPGFQIKPIRSIHRPSNPEPP
ncbi:fungal-specific transcription factor domain-containing protein [Mycena galericulata]|nr:fungal-specific transcription factor domain-containing protein [Mycena galericulata]